MTDDSSQPKAGEGPSSTEPTAAENQPVAEPAGAREQPSSEAPTAAGPAQPGQPDTAETTVQAEPDPPAGGSPAVAVPGDAGGDEAPPPAPPEDEDGGGGNRTTWIIAAVAAIALLLVGLWWMSSRGSGTEPEPVDPEPTSGAVNAELIGPIWKLLEFQEPRGTTLVDDANKYTLELKADGTAVATADCNPGIGSYSVSGLEISLDIAFSPADCGPDSLSEKYAQSVNEAVSYMLGGELLNVGYGSSGAVMRFTKGTVISAGSTSTDAPPTAEPTEAPAEPPTAEIDAPSSAKVGDLVTFDGSRSTGLNEIVAYLWDFGDDTNANAVRIDHAYSRAGTFIVTLTVVDDQKVSGTTTTQIVIEDAEEVPPTAAITGPAVADIGEDVSFDGSSSEAGSSPIVRYDWDLGGVSAGEAGNQSTVTTSYQTPGTYHVSLTVTDANGLSGSASHEIAINAPLEGTNWVLDGALPGTEITLLLRDGQASGFAGCNTYTTDYAVSGDLIGFRPPTLTQQQCAEQIMVQEQTYLNSLVTVQRYEIAGEDLTFTTASQPLQYTARAR